MRAEVKPGASDVPSPERWLPPSPGHGRIKKSMPFLQVSDRRSIHKNGVDVGIPGTEGLRGNKRGGSPSSSFAENPNTDWRS